MEKNFLEIKDDKINVEDIMNEIKKNIESKKIKEIQFPNIDLISIEGNRVFDKSTIDENLVEAKNLCNVQLYKNITSHRKIVGNLIVFIKKVIRKSISWYMEPIMKEQIEFNNSIVKNLNCISNYIKNNNINIDNVQMELDILKKTIDLERGKVINNSCTNLDENNNINNYFKDIYNCIAKLNNHNSEISKKIYNVECNLQNINQNIDMNQTNSIFLSKKIKRIEEEVSKKTLKKTEELKKEEIAIENKNIVNTNIDYLMFEQLFRGNENDIKEKQNIYLDYFKDKDNVLDIGCGRGEFLQVLISNGISARGIDVNKDMVEYCINKGLPVELTDDITYLSKIENDSLDGIFISQVVEHLEADHILKLIQLAYEKLRKNGVFIIETINPQCLSTFANSFYMDMTHIKPLHPLTIKFILQSQGFMNAKLVYLSEINEKLPYLNSDAIENIQEFNEGIERVNKLLFGAQDYAVIVNK